MALLLHLLAAVPGVPPLLGPALAGLCRALGAGGGSSLQLSSTGEVLSVVLHCLLVELADAVAFRAGMVIAMLLHECSHIASGALLGSPSDFITLSNLRGNVPALSWWASLSPLSSSLAALQPYVLRAKGSTSKPRFPNASDTSQRMFSSCGLKTCQSLSSEDAIIHLSGWLTSMVFSAAASTTWILQPSKETSMIRELAKSFTLGSCICVVGAFATDIVGPLLGIPTSGTYFCGNFGLLLANCKLSRLQGLRPLKIVEAMASISMQRGGQSGGLVTFLSAGNYVKDVRTRVVPSTKRASVSYTLLMWFSYKLFFAKVWLWAASIWSRGQAMEDLPALFVGHTRFATSSIPSPRETHPHQWTPTRPVKVWRATSPPNHQVVHCISENFGLYVTHNGDFEYWNLYGRDRTHAEIGAWLERVLDYPQPATCDSTSVAGLLELLRTQGLWLHSLRLAYIQTVAFSFEEMFDQAQVGHHTSQAPGREVLQILASTFETTFTTFLESSRILRRINLEDSRESSMRSFNSHAESCSPTTHGHNYPKDVGPYHPDSPAPAPGSFCTFENEGELITSLMHALRKEASPMLERRAPKRHKHLIELMDDMTLSQFVKQTVINFRNNDLFYATRKFLASAKGSFGLAVTCTLDPDRVILAALNQPLSIAFCPDLSAVMYSSESHALRVPLLRKGSNAERGATCRLELNEEDGEVLEVILAPPSASMTSQVSKPLFEVKTGVHLQASDQLTQARRAWQRGLPQDVNTNATSASIAGPRQAIGEEAVQIVHLGNSPDKGSDNSRFNEHYRGHGMDPLPVMKDGPELAGSPGVSALRPWGKFFAAKGVGRLYNYQKMQLPKVFAVPPTSARKSNRRIARTDSSASSVAVELQRSESIYQLEEIELASICPFPDNPYVQLRLFKHASQSPVTPAEFFSSGRLVSLEGNAYIPSSGPPQNGDIVDQDIKDIPRVLANIQREWSIPHSCNSQTAAAFLKLLKEKVEEKKGNATQASEVDVLIVGVESSLWVGEQFASDLQNFFPVLKVVPISANKVIGILGNVRGAISTAGFSFCQVTSSLRKAIVLCISQSGQTFPTLHATRVLLKECPGRVFVCVGMIDSKMSAAVGQAFGAGDPWSCRVLWTCASWRSAEPATVTAVAAHHTLTELMLFLGKKLATRKSGEVFENTDGLLIDMGKEAGPLGLRFSRKDIEDLHRVRDEFVSEGASELVGYSTDGRSCSAPVHLQLVKQGRQWGRHVIEGAVVWMMGAVYIIVTVGILNGGLLHLVLRWTHAHGQTKAIVTPFQRVVDTLIYIFIPLWCTIILRLLQGRKLFARMGKRTLVICDVPYVHQLLEIYVSKLFALSYSIATIEVHGANPIDHLVHRFTHRVIRGVLLAVGRPDGRLCSQTKCESWVLLAILQAKSIVHLGVGAETFTVGHNPFTDKLLIDNHVTLPSGRPNFLCEQLLNVHEQDPMKRLALQRQAAALGRHSVFVGINSQVVGDHVLKEAYMQQAYKIGMEILSHGTYQVVEGEAEDPASRSRVLQAFDVDVQKILEAQSPMEAFLENRFLSLQRYIAFLVTFHQMAKTVSSFWFLTFETHRSQSGLRIATTAAPVSASDLERVWLEDPEGHETPTVSVQKARERSPLFSGPMSKLRLSTNNMWHDRTHHPTPVQSSGMIASLQRSMSAPLPGGRKKPALSGRLGSIKESKSSAIDPGDYGARLPASEEETLPTVTIVT